MLGYWRITRIIDAEKMVEALSERNNNIVGRFYLPPLNRSTTSNISVNDVFFGALDTDSGYGALMCMVNGNDFDHRFNYDVNVNGNLQVLDDVTSTRGNITASIGNIKAVVGDCIATTVSLKQHVHMVGVIPPQDTTFIAAGVASVTAGTPTPIELTTTYTLVPVGG